MTDITDRFLKNASTAKLVLRTYRKQDKIFPKRIIKTRFPISMRKKDILMNFLNRDGRFDEYMDYLRYEVSWRMDKNYDYVDYPLDIGSIVYLELVMRDIDGDKYKAEPTQFYMMLDPAIQSAKTVTRRGAKSFTDKVPTFRDCVLNSGFHAQVTEQSWPVARMWLDDVYIWYHNNRLIQSWSKGKLKKDSEAFIKFGNNSYIMCYTASSLENISGVGVHKRIEDEKSLYTADTARARIIARGQPKKRGRDRSLHRISGTPMGAGTSFHNDQLNPEIWQYYAPMLCPMGFQKPVCYDCQYFTLTQLRRGERHNLGTLECTASLNFNEDGTPDFTGCYKRIPDNRFVYDELLEDWKALGKTLWMQEYMCATQDYTGNAIPLDLINAFFKDDLEKLFESKLPCIMGMDFGKSVHHCSALTIVAKLDTGVLRNVHTHVYPPGTPYLSGVYDGKPVVGVIEHSLSFFNNFPIYKVVADATGVGLPLVEEQMANVYRQNGINTNLIPFKFTGQSKKFGSKSEMWMSILKPAMESGRVESYHDRRLYSEMRAWQLEFDPSKDKTVKLHPPKAGEIQSDDAWISAMMGFWGGLTYELGTARKNVLMGSIKQEGISAFERPHYGR